MKLLTVKELSEIINVKQSTLYQWAELKQIPSVKLNGALRFDLDDVLQWIASCKKQPAMEYNALAQTHQRLRKGGPG